MKDNIENNDFNTNGSVYKLLIDTIVEERFVNNELYEEVEELKKKIEYLEDWNLFLKDEIGEELSKSKKLKEDLNSLNN